MSHPLIPEVKKFVSENPVAVFMKGTADFPMCGFSSRAVSALRAAGAKNVASFDVLSDDDMWTAVEELTEWPTSPLVFVKGEFIGGSDIVMELYEKGELEKMVADAQS